MVGLSRIAASSALVLALAGSVVAQAPAGTRWQYHFAPGDHLVYSERSERHLVGPKVESNSKSTFTTHVIVAGESGGTYSIGFARIRNSSDLLAYREDGKDRLAAEQPKFNAQVAARPAAMAEANEVDRGGRATHAWAAVRESSSRYLLAIHEIEMLPAEPVAPGSQWIGAAPLSLRFRFDRVEPLGGEQCARVEGAPEQPGPVRLTYWFCPDSGLMRKLIYNGDYTTFSGKMNETVTFELQEKRHESPQDFFSNGSTAQAALHALITSDWLSATSTTLSNSLRSSDSDIQTLALAVLYRRNMPVPDPALVQQLSHGNDAQVARIAARLLKPGALANKRADMTFLPGTSLYPMTSSGYDGYPYILHVPLDYRGDEPFPLIVHLSGGPGFAMDAANISEETIRKTGYLVLYPHAAARMWWDAPTVAMLDQLLNELSSKLNIRRDAIYVTGFSNGGTGAVSVASKWPQRFAGVVSLMGGASCVTEAGPIQYNKLGSVPFLLVHGDHDPIIPAECSEDLYKKLRAHRTAELTLRILKGHGHDITLASDDGLTLSFIDKLSGTH